MDHVVDMHTFHTHPISWTNQEVTGVSNLIVAHGMLTAIHINPDKASHSPPLPAGSAGYVSLFSTAFLDYCLYAAKVCTL